MTVMKMDGIRGQLLPGIPDDITITTICPKLSWGVLHNLAVVNRGWLRALQNGRVYEARIFAKSTNTIFVYVAPGVEARVNEARPLRLYSVDDASVYSIPVIPNLSSAALVRSFTYTSVNGKLYVFGSTGSRGYRETECRRSPYLERTLKCQPFTYEYDLARHRGWRQRATTNFMRKPDECAVMNGKIFICGKDDTQLARFKFAMYDCDADVWCPIISSTYTTWSPIVSHADRAYQTILAVPKTQESLVNQERIILDNQHPTTGLWRANAWISQEFCPIFLSFASGAVTETAVKDVESGRRIALALVDGRFLKITQQGLDVYDSHTDTWTPLHFEGPFEFSNSDFLSERSVISTHCGVGVAVVRTKNTIYSVVDRMVISVDDFVDSALFLMRSEAVSIQNSEGQECSESQQDIAPGPWKQVECNVPLDDKFLRCPVQL